MSLIVHLALEPPATRLLRLSKYLFGSTAGPVGLKFAEFNDLKLVGALYANGLWPKFTLNTLAPDPDAQAKAIG